MALVQKQNANHDWCACAELGYYDAYYKKAQTVRTKLINEFNEAFKKVDYLVGPVAPTTAFKIGANEDQLRCIYRTS